ncbi:hypothetical protein PROVRUST_07983 [Providencia rustigianii DSM 4541]|uniref:Uncharacterized protein n=1 Tax=Providencia rustigianii DSM 4541 TaxID=500637 RepID=D1P6W4_9GAMM|nr:hypothetical protein PROVRUST_07983 [Providencia rustigianii DSM 4541]
MFLMFMVTLNNFYNIFNRLNVALSLYWRHSFQPVMLNIIQIQSKYCGYRQCIWCLKDDKD